MIENLQRAIKFLESEGYDPYYIAVHGSQNYGLSVYTDEYKSDFDYKCIIIPKLEDLVVNSKPLSTVIEFEGGQIDIKDIRAYTESVVKCNINFLEILDTQSYIGKPFYRDLLVPLMQEMGQFYLRACYGMMLEKYEALRHPYPSTISKIEKFGYDPKQLHHIIRLCVLMKRYTENPYKMFHHESHETRFCDTGGSWYPDTEYDNECTEYDFNTEYAELGLYPTSDFLIDVKLGKIPNSDVDRVAHHYLAIAKKIREGYTVEPKFATKEKIIARSYSIIYNEICSSIKSNKTIDGLQL